jgi:hypothetical protein
MKFVAPNLHKGINTTIRRGKWLAVAKVSDPICLCDMDSNILGFGIIQKIRHTKLSGVTQKEIDNLACFLTTKTMKCLSETLSRIYCNFNPNEIAVVTFTRLPQPDKYEIIDYGRLDK